MRRGATLAATEGDAACLGDIATLESGVQELHRSRGSCSSLFREATAATELDRPRGSGDQPSSSLDREAMPAGTLQDPSVSPGDSGIASAPLKEERESPARVPQVVEY